MSFTNIHNCVWGGRACTCVGYTSLCMQETESNPSYHSILICLCFCFDNQGFHCLCFPSAGIISTHHPRPAFFMGSGLQIQALILVMQSLFWGSSLTSILKDNSLCHRWAFAVFFSTCFLFLASWKLQR